MKFNEKIYALRKARGLSQEKLAEELDVSRQAVSKWENGDACPDMSKLFIIAKFFGVTTDFLIDESQNEFEPVNTNNNFEPANKIIKTAERTYSKYSWILGALVCIIGFIRFITGIISIITMSSAINATGHFSFALLPLFSSLLGIGIFIIGIVLIKKLRK